MNNAEYYRDIQQNAKAQELETFANNNQDLLLGIDNAINTAASSGLDYCTYTVNPESVTISMLQKYLISLGFSIQIQLNNITSAVFTIKW